MGRRVILDTGVLIAAERGSIALDSFDDDDDLAISAVTVAELMMGVELANTTNRARRQQFVDSVLALIPVEDYTTSTARAHARLMAHTLRSGETRGAYDLIIASTAVVTARTVVTTDKAARFSELPGVESLLLTGLSA